MSPCFFISFRESSAKSPHPFKGTPYLCTSHSVTLLCRKIQTSRLSSRCWAGARNPRRGPAIVRRLCALSRCQTAQLRRWVPTEPGHHSPGVAAPSPGPVHRPAQIQGYAGRPHPNSSPMTHAFDQIGPQTLAPEITNSKPRNSLLMVRSSVSRGPAPGHNSRSWLLVFCISFLAGAQPVPVTLASRLGLGEVMGKVTSRL